MMFDHTREHAKIQDEFITSLRELKGENTVEHNKLYRLLADFGISRSCSNCNHGRKCCVMKENNDKRPENYRHNTNVKTMCDEVYWERREDNGN